MRPPKDDSVSAEIDADTWHNVEDGVTMEVVKANVESAKSQLYTLKFKPNKKVEAFLRRVEKLRASLLALGEEVPDATLMPIVLRSLPPYLLFMTTLNLSDQTVNFDKLVNLLQQEEAMCNKDDEEEQTPSSHQKRKDGSGWWVLVERQATSSVAAMNSQVLLCVNEPKPWSKRCGSMIDYEASESWFTFKHAGVDVPIDDDNDDGDNSDDHDHKPLEQYNVCPSDHVGNIDGRKSTSGFVFFFGSGLISWGSKKQNFVSRSSTEAEYRVVGGVVCEVIWLRHILEGLGVPREKPTTLYVDNEGQGFEGLLHGGAKMSVVGFDVGNESCIVAVARQRGIDVVLNDESKRETPALVCFGEKQRFIGTAGAASSLMNPKNTVSQIKRLIGKQFSDPDLQRDLQSLPFAVTEGPDGTPLIQARYLGEYRSFTPTQILAMILSNIKQIAKDNLKTEIVDCCIGIPVYFTDLERRGVLDAAAIVNLNPLCLLHETTATALAYGIYKTDLSETDPLNVVFVDIGHASMQVCVAAFKKGELKVLAHAFDRSLGGRDFDEALFRHFAAIFKQQYNIDVPSNVRASQRLRTACEKLKKVLSANPEAPLNIECLMDEKDVRGFIRRDEFEQLSLPILERVKGPCERALLEAELTADKIHAVEVVGSGSRVPSIMKILTEFFGKEPRRTMNASECVARGCALQCAILSPTFKVRDFKIQERFPFSIALSWKGSSPEMEDRAADQLQYSIVFPKGNIVPSTKAVTIFRSGTFTLDVLYADPSQVQAPQRISSYTIGPFQTPNGERAKIKVKVQLDKHGVVSVASATMIEEEEVEVPVTTAKENVKEEKVTVAMETDDGQSNGVPEVGENVDINMQETKNSSEQSSAGTTSENGASEMEDKTAQMETEAKVKVVKKKKTKKTELTRTEIIFGGLPRADLQKAVEKEFEMALQDRIMEETKEKKNAVEAYVYDMRNKLHEKYQQFVTEQERENLTMVLQTVEDWLYDEGEDETKGVYVAKLAELKKYGDPIEERYREDLDRGPAMSQLEYCLSSFRDAAFSKDPKFDHIDIADKQKVVNECNDAEQWLNEKRQQQNSLPKHANPFLLASDVKRKTETLDRFCRPIMMKPRPTPAKPQQSSPIPQPAETQANDSADNNAPPPEGQAPPTEPMDTDNTYTPENE
ncbi:hypothetical protein KI387_003208 [Taxus chinensis]|uniref:Heat shock 70 kDa protein 14 n=1 Tax=Taxus chinensis TaxID=29808 RepID=A0AA38LQK5_TAXCH|nr:hypothetical protein KI387_003208 [Taxus chinensis]